MGYSKLEHGKSYWIFTGMMEAIEVIFQRYENDKTTAILSSLPRNPNSVYPTREAALKANKY